MLQLPLKKNNITIYFEKLRKINITIHFEKLSIELHVFYDLNTYAKFCGNRILSTIGSINLYFMHNLKIQKHII